MEQSQNKDGDVVEDVSMMFEGFNFIPDFILYDQTSNDNNNSDGKIYIYIAWTCRRDLMICRILHRSRDRSTATTAAGWGDRAVNESANTKCW